MWDFFTPIMPITTSFVAKVPRGTLGFDVNLRLPMWDFGNGCGTLGIDVGLQGMVVKSHIRNF